jgi:hypothetical protein
MEIRDESYAEEAIKFFMDDECKHIFTSQGMTEKELLCELKDGWKYILIGDNHITSYKEIDSIAEVHTYTRKCVDRRDALKMLESVLDYFKDNGTKILVTYVPIEYCITKNFLKKRLGFIDLGTRTVLIDGVGADINMLIKEISE